MFRVSYVTSPSFKLAPFHKKKVSYPENLDGLFVHYRKQPLQRVFVPTFRECMHCKGERESMLPIVLSLANKVEYSCLFIQSPLFQDSRNVSSGELLLKRQVRELVLLALQNEQEETALFESPSRILRCCVCHDKSFVDEN